MEICHVPQQRAYAREFSGFATQGKALEEGLRLKTLLLEDKARPDASLLYWHADVLYDAVQLVLLRR